jgi:hypothetical protein
MRRKTWLWIILVAMALCGIVATVSASLNRKPAGPPQLAFLKGASELDLRQLPTGFAPEVPDSAEKAYGVRMDPAALRPIIRTELSGRGWRSFPDNDSLWSDDEGVAVSLLDGRYTGKTKTTSHGLTYPVPVDETTYSTILIHYSTKPPRTWVERAMKRLGF